MPSYPTACSAGELRQHCSIGISMNPPNISTHPTSQGLGQVLLSLCLSGKCRTQRATLSSRILSLLHHEKTPKPPPLALSSSQRDRPSSAMAEPYLGLKFDPTNQIRVLRIQPSSDPNAIVHATLFVVTPDDPTHEAYNALSYCWGDESIRRNINISGNEVSVTYSLESALKHLRKDSEELSIWADAVCINQKDEAEKNRQVMMMGKVYKKAENVFVWLGIADDDSNLAMDTCNEWGGRTVGSKNYSQQDITPEESTLVGEAQGNDVQGDNAQGDNAQGDDVEVDENSVRRAPKTLLTVKKLTGRCRLLLQTVGTFSPSSSTASWSLIEKSGEQSNASSTVSIGRDCGYTKRSNWRRKFSSGAVTKRWHGNISQD